MRISKNTFKEYNMINFSSKNERFVINNSVNIKKTPNNLFRCVEFNW
jgi:hypothetical protein